MRSSLRYLRPSNRFTSSFPNFSSSLSNLRQFSSSTTEFPSTRSRLLRGGTYLLGSALLASGIATLYRVNGEEEKKGSSEEKSKISIISESEKEQLRKEFEAEKDRSEPRDQDPYFKGLTIVVGDSVDDIILNNKKQDVLLEFYSDDCSYCAKMKPIYEQLAYAFEEVPNVVIAKMNVDRNFRRGLLTFESGTPEIKFFPANLTPEEKLKQAKEVNKASAKALIEFIYENRKTEWTEEEKQKVLKRAESYREKAMRELDKILEADKESNLFLTVHDRSPCGGPFTNDFKGREFCRHGLIELEDYQKYREGYVQCVKKKRERLIAYWKELGEIAFDELRDLLPELHKSGDHSAPTSTSTPTPTSELHKSGDHPAETSTSTPTPTSSTTSSPTTTSS